MYRYLYQNNLKRNSKKLRRNQTKEEAILWNILRNRRLNGLKFRRQFSIGYYILDFYCIEKKFAIELDGGQHNDEKKIIYDLERTKYLNNIGIKVIRFWNNDVRNNINGVLEVIANNLQ